MKWYKHISDSLDDPDISDAMELFGAEAYLVFFGTLEVMSREFDEENPGISTVSLPFLRKKLSLSRQKVVRILSFFSQKSRIFYEIFDENGLEMIRLNCPKLKKLADNWTEQKLRSKNEAEKKELSLEEEGEEEVDKEKEKKKKDRGFAPKSLFDSFLEINKELPTPEIYTKERQGKCSVRIRVDGFYDRFCKAVALAQESPFLRGDNDRGWKADFDWFIANETNVAKVLEGKYESRKSNEWIDYES